MRLVGAGNVHCVKSPTSFSKWAIHFPHPFLIPVRAAGAPCRFGGGRDRSRAGAGPGPGRGWDRRTAAVIQPALWPRRPAVGAGNCRNGVRFPQEPAAPGPARSPPGNDPDRYPWRDGDLLGRDLPDGGSRRRRSGALREGGLQRPSRRTPRQTGRGDGCRAPWR